MELGALFGSVPRGIPPLRIEQEKTETHGIPLTGSLVVVAFASEQREECELLHRLDPPQAEPSLPAAESCSGFFMDATEKGPGRCPE